MLKDNVQYVEKSLEDRAIVILSQNGVETKGSIYDVREKIETLLEEKTNIFVSLQENFDTDELTFSIAVHSDSYEDCDEEDIKTFSELGLTDCEEETTKNLFKLLAIEVRFSHYEKQTSLY